MKSLYERFISNLNRQFSAAADVSFVAAACTFLFTYTVNFSCWQQMQYINGVVDVTLISQPI